MITVILFENPKLIFILYRKNKMRPTTIRRCFFCRCCAQLSFRRSSTEYKWWHDTRRVRMFCGPNVIGLPITKYELSVYHQGRSLFPRSFGVLSNWSFPLRPLFITGARTRDERRRVVVGSVWEPTPKFYCNDYVCVPRFFLFFFVFHKHVMSSSWTTRTRVSTRKRAPRGQWRHDKLSGLGVVHVGMYSCRYTR